MSQPAHILRHKGNAPPDWQQPQQNKRVMLALCELLDAVLVPGAYGQTTLTVRYEDGILMSDIEVTQCHKHRVPKPG